MNNFLRDWFHNLWVTVAAVIGAGLFMLIFMRIFYPESIPVMYLMAQGGIEFITMLKLWPFVVLGIFISALPRRRRE
jgi:hypothetical protein